MLDFRTAILLSDYDCALRSFVVAELLLLFRAENFVNVGLHAGVRDDQPCQQTCFCIDKSFGLSVRPSRTRHRE
jgi:hypothetical protein